ncbi:MAG: hypothetical protein ABI946_07720 [Chthoniobacterales bacterium]
MITKALFKIGAGKQASPSPDITQNYLYGVTCQSAFLCWAVGQFNNGNGQGTLIEKWMGMHGRLSVRQTWTRR